MQGLQELSIHLQGKLLSPCTLPCADQPPLASQPAGEAAASAAVTPATAGPLDRFLRAGSQPQATPQPPRAAAAAAVQGPGEVVILDEDEGNPAPMDVDAPPAAAAAQTPSTKDEVLILTPAATNGNSSWLHAAS